MEDVTRVDRCELLVGDAQCGLIAGHEPPCAISMVVPLSADLGRLLEQTMTEYETAARGYKRAQRWLWAACVVNILVAAWNLWSLWQ